MEDIAGELRCPVCLEFYQAPVVFPCAHVLCRAPCAERLFEGNFVKCPVCRENSFVSGGIDNLPRVLLLENIIDRYHNPPDTPVTVPEQDICGPEDIPCQLCEGNPNKAKKSCLDCNASYCEKCLQISHPQRNPFIQHKLVIPTRIERPKKKELLCPQHSVKVNIFCADCQALGCVLCADDSSSHPAHRILSIDQATQLYNTKLQRNLYKLETAQESFYNHICGIENKQSLFQNSCLERRNQINEQCDALLNEVNAKREFFLSDLDYEENAKSESFEHQIQEMGGQKSNIESIILHTKDVLAESVPEVFLQLAKSVSERSENALASATGSCLASPTNTALHHKVLDLRKEKAILKDISYLTVPSTPVIEVSKCTRSVHSVVLVLCSPQTEYDVIDEYHVYYSTLDEEHLGVKHMVVFKTPGEPRKHGRGPSSLNAVCLIHNDLLSDTCYKFSVRAHNNAGDSDVSQPIQCITLRETQSKLKVPEIVEPMCRTYSSAIHIHSPSPCEDRMEGEEISFYLLYREAAVDKIWKSIPLCSRVDHRVFGLDSDTTYDFVIMACDSHGECQVSNMVCLRTERSAV